MEWSKLKPRERAAVWLLGACAFFGLYIRFVERPVTKKVSAYKSQINQSAFQLKDLETKKPQDVLLSAKIKDLEAQESKLTAEIADLEKKMPSQFNTSQLVAEITQLAREVKLESVKQRVTKEQTYSRIFLEIKFYSTYQDAVQYLADIEAISPFIRVDEFEILEPIGKTVELGGAPVKIMVSCLLGDTAPADGLKPGKAGTVEMKRDILASSSKPTEALSDKKFLLEGITFDARNPTAIVNGDVYMTGSKLGPYTVKKILTDSVILNDGVEDHTLSLKAVEAVS